MRTSINFFIRNVFLFIFIIDSKLNLGNIVIKNYVLLLQLLQSFDENFGPEFTYLFSTAFELLLYCWFGNSVTEAVSALFMVQERKVSNLFDSHYSQL